MKGKTYVRITSFFLEEIQNSGIHSQKGNSNHYFGVNSTLILEWIQLQNEVNLIKYDS